MGKNTNERGERMLDEKTSKMLKFLIYVAFIGVLIFALIGAVKYVLPLVYPFVIAWIISLLLHPVVSFLEKHVRIPRKLSISLLVITAVALISTAAYFLVTQLLGELQILAENILAQVTELRENPDLVDQRIEKIDSFVPFISVADPLKNFWDNLDEKIINLLASSAKNITDDILPLLMTVVSGFADLLLNFIIIVVACFYMTIDYKKISSFISEQFSDNARKIFTIIKEEFFETTGKYLKAYSIILFITFTELLVAFLIIDIKYAFLLALIISLVDILPVVGTGTVLIPWSLFLIFVSKDYYTGIAILVTYLIITVIREIIEPRIVGSYIGLYPLVTLVAMYVGLRLYGIIGLFLLPITIIIIKNLSDDGHIKLWKYPKDEEENKKTKKPFRITDQFMKLFGKKQNANKSSSSAEETDGTKNG